MNRGSVQGDLAVAGRTVASMRPRFMNRGSSIEYRPTTKADWASMRPRFMNRGSANDGAAMRETAPLQ